MAKNFNTLLKKMTPEQRARVEEGFQKLKAELPLQALREARGLTQTQLAESMDIPQSAVSKMERQADMYISTLRRFVEAMGGELDIAVRFGDQSVRVTQLGEPNTPPSSKRRKRAG